ncbi:MAG: 30S ribosomal protein S4, partial [Candidatus Diapherotrites archaeon]|nr:30S ribosomal protein S4 [Candidatus Diapherotrites archaeon]
LVKSLARYGFLQENATLDDVFGLEIREVLEKRLQTLVWRQNLAKTVMQARQFIVHGHIAIAGAKMTSPNYLVPAEKVEKIGYFGGKQLQLEPLKPEKTEEQKKEFEEAGQEAQETGEELEGGVIEDAE